MTISPALIAAIVSLVTALFRWLVSVEQRKIGRDQAALEVLQHATKKLEAMAAIAATPIEDDELEQRLKDGTF